MDAVYRHVREGAAGGAAPAPTAPAAAAILWRRRGGGLEVFLARRAPSLPFLGGFWTFPGGSVEPGDRALPVDSAAGDEAAAIAACAREVAEEIGVTLPLDARAFVPAGRWVTPAFAQIRFDARYYLVRSPDGAEPDATASGGELTEGRWVAPDAALGAWERGAWLVPPPVVRVLRVLSAGLDAFEDRCAAEADAEHGGTRLWDLAPGVAVVPVRTPTLPPATHTNCYAVGTDEIVVIDPASPYPDERAVLDEALGELVARGGRIAAIALTHHHADHVGGVRHLAERTGAPVWAHEATAARVADRVRVDRELADGERIELAGSPRRALEVLHTPGHAPGHLCFVDEQTRFAVVGDMVASIGTILVDPDEGDMAAYLRSLERLRASDLSVLLPAHGGPLPDPETKLAGYVAHRLWREEGVASALSRLGTASARELVPEVYTDVPASVHPLAERSLLAHLFKLEGEARVRREGERWRPRGASGDVDV